MQQQQPLTNVELFHEAHIHAHDENTAAVRTAANCPN
jgi:hypothetical protein